MRRQRRTHNGILEIVDSDGAIDILPFLRSWQPSVPVAQVLKARGVFGNGSVPVMRTFDDPVDSFDLVLSAEDCSQDILISRIRAIRKKLESARNYWINPANSDPVYLRARSPRETNIRYATIKDFSDGGDSVNPYTQPFWSSRSVLPDYLLTIEHSIWQSDIPGSATAIEVSNEEDYQVVVLDNFWTPAQDTDDKHFVTQDSVLYDYAYVGAGNLAGKNLGALIRFTNVTVPQGASIGQARIAFYAEATQSGDDCNLRIAVQNTSNASTFSTYANYAARGWLTTTVPWPNVEHMNIGNVYSSPYFTDLIQQIVDRSDWVSGNNIAVMIYDDPLNPSDTNAYRQISAFNSVAYDPPQLELIYSVGEVTFGRAETTSNEVFVRNADPHNQISEVWYHDAGVGYTRTRIYGDPLPYYLADVVPANGDAVYFGISDAIPNAGPFGGLVFDLLQGFSAVTDAEWQYYSSSGGGTWTTLDTVVDHTARSGIPLVETGVRSVHWEQPSDWIVNDDLGFDAWLVRVYITTTSGGNRPRQQNREIYIPIPFVDIAADQVAGDLPALARILLYPQSAVEYPVNHLALRDIMISLRSYSRGADFSPFINMSENHNALSITVDCPTGIASITANSLSPSGYSLNWTPGGTSSGYQVAVVTIGANVVDQFAGKYRVFARVYQSGGVAGDIGLRLRASNYTFSSGFTSTGQYDVTHNADMLDVLDLGQLTIPDDVNQELLIIEGGNTNGSPPTLKIYDLILMPVDEWSGEFKHDSFSFSDEHYIDIDSAKEVRRSVKSIGRLVSDDSALVPLTPITAGEIILQIDGRQRIWFFCKSGIYVGSDLLCYPEISFSVQIERVLRYYSMRGSE